MKIKKAISLVFSFLLLFSPVLPVGARSFGGFDEESFIRRIDYLQETFVEGEYWNSDNSADYSCTGPDPGCLHDGCCGFSDGEPECDNCGTFAGHYQCWGYAYKMAFLVFGSYPTQKDWVDYPYSDKIFAGDVIRFGDVTHGHSVFVYKVIGNTAYYTDCNSDGPCIVHWNRTFTISADSELNGYKIFRISHLAGNDLKGTRKGEKLPASPAKADYKIDLSDGGNSVAFTWSPVDGAIDYVYGFGQSPFKYVERQLSGKTEGLSVTFSDVMNGSYCFMVRAENGYGRSEEATSVYLTVDNGDRELFNLGIYGSHFYAAFDETSYYMYAADLCSELNGYLACIGSEEENEFVKTLISGGKLDSYWIGLRNYSGGDYNSDSEYLWQSGEYVSYTNWMQGEPDDSGEGFVKKHFAAIGRMSGKWSLYSVSGESGSLEGSGFVIEIPLDTIVRDLREDGKDIGLLNLFSRIVVRCATYVLLRYFVL